MTSSPLDLLIETFIKGLIPYLALQRVTAAHFRFHGFVNASLA